jgi:hypothetical protein
MDHDEWNAHASLLLADIEGGNQRGKLQTAV